MTVTRRWVADPTDEGTQALNPVFTYRDNNYGLEVCWQLYFSANGPPNPSAKYKPTVLNKVSINAMYKQSLLALKILDCNFRKFYCTFIIRITQKLDILSPTQTLFCYTEDSITFKSRRRCPVPCKTAGEENIYWILFNKPRWYPQPIEIVFAIKSGYGLRKSVPVRSTKWIADSLAAQPAASEFQNELWKMHEENRATDASIVVRNERNQEEVETLKVHWILLEARSPVLAAMFKHDCVEKDNREIVIVDFGKNVMKKFIKFLYTDECDLQDDDEVMQLLACADKYDVPKLKMKCQAVLAKSLNVQNAVNVLQIADLHGANLLKAEALKFIKNHYKVLAPTPEWKSMTAELLNDFIKLALDH